MSDMFYGVTPSRDQLSTVEAHLEELALYGYSVMHGVLPAEAMPEWRRRIDENYDRQLQEFGEEKLKAIRELDICRAPLLQDAAFIELALHPKVLEVMRYVLGDWFILNLQNAIINRPGQTHHQSAWHRDLPHQNWVISRPIAAGALFVIDEFTAMTGATLFLPTSHRHEVLPSQGWISNHAKTIEAPAGSVILFDAMIFHRAGANRSQIVRRAVNHLYTVPILKQQYDFPRALGNQPFANPEAPKVLGYTSQVPLDASAWRQARLQRR